MLILRLSLLAVPIGLMAGGSSALFLGLLDLATRTRTDTAWLVWLLPLGGLVIGLINHRSDPVTNLGTPAVLAAARGASGPLPRALAPTVLTTTVVTHLFGGSAGREGTAVQMSAGLTDWLLAGPLGSRHRRPWSADPLLRPALLRIAIAAGFGAVFAVPWAAAVFGLEVTRSARGRHSGPQPRGRWWPVVAIASLIAALVGDRVVHALGIAHLPLPVLEAWDWSVPNGLRLLLAGLGFGLGARLFIGATRLVAAAFRFTVPWSVARPVVGAVLILALVGLFGTRDYLGLSLPVITDALTLGTGVAGGAFAAKILFTAITLGSGFRGGEVTPLFVIGASLGASMAGWIGAAEPALAAVGMIAVFSGAALTPWAGAVMAIEMFGWSFALPVLLASLITRRIVGRRGIYHIRSVEKP